MTAVEDTNRTSREARRAERVAIAQALMDSPPPLDALDDLDVRRVRVTAGDVVHASRSRPVVRWHLSILTDNGQALSMRVIGKAFNKGGGEHAGQLLAALRDAGFDSPEFAVPRPLGWDPGRRLLAQEEAPPGTLHALLEDPANDRLDPPRRVGRWLARLHAVPELPLQALPEDFEVRALDRYGPALREALPAAGGRIQQLVDATTHALDAVRLPLVPTHGDFQPKNVHLDADRVMVIDFDRAALAPAARDVGHFVGQTRTMAAARHGSLAWATPWVEAFVEGYLERGGSHAAVAAAPAYVARTYAEVLFYRLVVRPVGHTDFVPGWLDAWENCLAGGEPKL